MQCNKCGGFVADSERFCGQCGAQLGSLTTNETGTGIGSTDERQWAMGAHLSGLAGMIIPGGNIVAPIVIWQMKKNESPFIAEQAKEAANFPISLSLYGFAAFLLCFLGIGFLILPVVGLGGIVLMVLAAIKANNGEEYRYPLTLRLIK